MPTAISLRVEDVDASYRSALEAGATSLQAPSDQSYGARSASLRDLGGNHWYIFKSEPGSDVFEGFRTVTPYLHPVRSLRLIDFLQRAFGAEETYRAESPDGIVHHAQVRIGNSVIGMGDAHGIYQSMPSTLHFYVNDVDGVYQQALRAGAESIRPPEDQPYGERNFGVKDPFGNQWWVAMQLSDRNA
jgi:PhnB protein